ncbi:MAG: tRNA (N6-threonylcarbamoyladenosine(37)-N6)-methyltransferase TrmO [Phycisphaerales bacterium]|jgi:tRNA (adenine37-N6)-methyltransferase|nr:tRNA (N6-threonylcarbamoyladenosine(37)-N6)-methyltransferase TrmO [Phycisphaerales bacterium]
MEISLATITPIGIIHSPFQVVENMPIQPKGAAEVTGEIELFPQFAEGLKDLEGFSHIYLIYQFHKAGSEQMRVKPFMDNVSRGVFATRAPVRPNHIGLSVVKLVSVDGNRITVSEIDVLDGTPLLDIKPYIEKFDHPGKTTSGWLDANAADIRNKRSDDRFA